MKLTRHLFGVALALFGATFLHAAVSIGNSNVQIGGFFSQGYIKSNGNNFPFEDKDGTWDFREMGVNVSTTVGSHLRLGAQGFAQRLGNYGEDTVRLDWAVADYNFRQEIGVRVGRIKYPKGLYGEALDLDAIRPFIFLPTGIYNPILRDFFASFDGAMVYGTLGLGKAGSLDYKVFYGDISMNPDMGVADFFNGSGLFASPGPQKLGTDSVQGVSFDWSTPIAGLKIHASRSKLKGAFAEGKFAAMPVLPINLMVNYVNYTTVGAEYVRDNWTFAGEWFYQSGTTHIEALPALNSNGDYGSTSYYASVARRFQEKWEIGAYYSHAHNLYPSAGSPSVANHLNDRVLSLRYDVNEHLIVKLELHSIEGRYNIFNTPKNPNPTFKDSTTLIAVKTTLSF